MKFPKLRTFLRKASKKLGFSKGEDLTLSQELRVMAAYRQTSPIIFNTVMKMIIKVRGLTGHHRRQFRANWRAEYNWKDTSYLVEAADMLEMG